jgi:HEAT repeat protein
MQASVQSLGSLGRHLYKSGDDARAALVQKQLLEELKKSSKADDAAMLVAAVGNLARSENVPVLLRYSADSHDQVRANVATALGEIRTPEAMSALLDLTADSSAQVASVALSSLAHGTVDDQLLASVEARVVSGKTNPDSDAVLIATFGSQLTPHGPVERMFRAILARSPDDSRIAGALHASLDRLPEQR